MNRNKKKGFTLVELLAVIVILAIILVIAVPKIMETIKNAKIGSMESSAKLIAKSVETNYQVSLANGEAETLSLTGSCLDAKIADIDLNEYESCTYTITDGKAKVTLKGKDSGKFAGLTCTDATKVSATCTSDSNDEGDTAYCTTGEDIVSIKPKDKNTCVSSLNNLMASKFFGNSYDLLSLDDQNDVNDISVKICDEDEEEIDILKIKLSYGMLTVEEISDIFDVTFFCIESNTLSKNYANKMGIDIENVYKIEFLNSNNFNDTVLTGVDVSQKEDGSVIGYFNNENGTLSFVSDEIIKFQYNSRELFSYFSNLNSIEFNNYVDTSNVIDMYGMFKYCSSLETLNLSSFDTSNVTNMISMFNRCSSLETLNLSSFDTSKVTNMSFMFYNCESLETLNLSSFDTSNVTDMYGMFESCESLETLNLSNFDTSNVNDMQEMFFNCLSLKNLNLSNFNTSNVIYINNMFNRCESLETLDLSHFDTSKVECMSGMFYRCESLETLDLSSFDTSNITDMRDMYQIFYQCSSLTSILAGTEADKNKFEATEKPSTAIVTVKTS